MHKVALAGIATPQDLGGSFVFASDCPALSFKIREAPYLLER